MVISLGEKKVDSTSKILGEINLYHCFFIELFWLSFCNDSGHGWGVGAPGSSFPLADSCMASLGLRLRALLCSEGVAVS